MEGLAAAGAAGQGQGIAAEGEQVHAGLHADRQCLALAGRLAHQGLQASQLHQHVGQHPRGRRLAGHHRQAELRQGLGAGQALQLLGQAAVVAQHPQLAHAPQAAPAAHLQLQVGQGHGGGQAALRPPATGYGQAQ